MDKQMPSDWVCSFRLQARCWVASGTVGAADLRMPLAAQAVEWSGTFHAVGAKLLRLYAGSIGLDPAFSILDRSDSADLMDLARDELRLSETQGRFPQKATCLAIYSNVVNGQVPLHDVITRFFPWCSEWEEELKRLFAAYVEMKQAQAVLDYDDLLLYWSKMMAIAEIALDPPAGSLRQVALQQFQRGRSERVHVRQAVGLAGFDGDGFLRHACNSDATVSRAVAISVSGRARGAGFGKAPAGGKALPGRAREQERIRFGRRAHPSNRLARKLHQQLPRLARVHHGPAEKIRRGAGNREQRGRDETAGRGLGDRDGLAACF